MEKFPKDLLDGYRIFMGGRFSHESQRYKDLAEQGQEPHTLVIACCDSRVAPETIFNCGPGELFVVRNVANLVPFYAPDGKNHATSAAIEFAVQSLKVRQIVVMGHGRCGGVKAVLAQDMEPLEAGDFIGQWMDMLKPAADNVRQSELMTDAERQTALERISVRNSIENLRSFPYVKALEDQGELTISGSWFDISTGELWIMDSSSGDFFRPEL